MHKRYAAAGTSDVLAGVSIQVAAGDFLCLMGASGSGKTTLLNLIGGLDTPDSGELHVLGEELQRLPDAERSEFRLRNIGFVFQSFNLLPHLNVRENIMLPLLFLGRGEREATEEALRLAEEVGLAEKFGRQATQLSGGEMQRVAIARALANNPRLILADEPTGNLDSATGTRILKLLRSVATTHGVTVILATHDPKAAPLCDRVIHMVDGRIVEGGQE